MIPLRRVPALRPLALPAICGVLATSAVPQGGWSQSSETPGRAARCVPSVEPALIVDGDVARYQPRSAPPPPTGYLEEEYFIACTVDGQPYRTTLDVWRPADALDASGVVIVEPTHPGNLWPVRSTTHAYLADAKHVSLAVSSSRFVVERLVKPAAPERYAGLSIPESSALSATAVENAILAQVGVLVRRNAIPGIAARKVILAGYSNTGGKVRAFIEGMHETERREDGGPIYDGYFPGQTAVGTLPGPIPDLDVPVLELQGERELLATFLRNPKGLAYRRPEGEQYRLWEVPAMSHLDTSEDDRSLAPGQCGIDAPERVSRFPLHDIWHAALAMLIGWVESGVAPPSAPRIELLDDGRTIARDPHGNALGGVPTPQILVPTARYTAIHPRDEASSVRCDMIGSQLDFSREQLIALYGTYAGYRDAFAAKLAELVDAGWVLERDTRELLQGVDGMRAAFGATGETGIAIRNPVFGGACKTCPWGEVAELVRDAMEPDGWNVQICYQCARADAPRIVAAASQPPPWRGGIPTLIPDDQIPLPPNGPVDFGATSVKNLVAAYHGTGPYTGEGARDNLRLIGVVQAPSYLLVAVRSSLGISDLAQLRERCWPVRILGRRDDARLERILAYYGLSIEQIEAAGGSIERGALPAQRKGFDLILQDGAVGNAPEYNLWTELSEQHELTFLQLPDELLDQLAQEDAYTRQIAPVGLLRGVDRPIATVARSGHAVYTRDNVPDDFAYAVAKAMDERQGLLQWSHLTLSYNRHTVWQALDVPLHPGAARYYREQGFLP